MGPHLVLASTDLFHADSILYLPPEGIPLLPCGSLLFRKCVVDARHLGIPHFSAPYDFGLLSFIWKQCLGDSDVEVSSIVSICYIETDALQETAWSSIR